MIKINNTEVDLFRPTYFIADIAANHDKDINRAKDLIVLAKKSGANAAKFQHFKASTIVSDKGFKDLGEQIAHQALWSKSVFETYEAAELPSAWTEELSTFSKSIGIDFFTSPYDLQLIDEVEPFVCAFKIGSGDITWLESIERMASFKKPVILATGASGIEDVSRAYKSISKLNHNIVIMQCNTNYTNSDDNFNYLNLKVLETYAKMFPNVVLGLSDHTPGHIAVLGAVALGARVIEKHFTDDNNRLGPDHKFSLNPTDWSKMVSDVRTLEKALGDGMKMIEGNELESVIVQQRSLYYARNLKKGTLLTRADLTVLRPCPSEAIKPFELNNVLGRVLKSDVNFHDGVRWSDLH
jgi:N-acetylneuraminate synthase